MGRVQTSPFQRVGRVSAIQYGVVFGVKTEPEKSFDTSVKAVKSRNSRMYTCTSRFITGRGIPGRGVGSSRLPSHWRIRKLSLKRLKGSGTASAA